MALLRKSRRRSPAMAVMGGAAGIFCLGLMMAGQRQFGSPGVDVMENRRGLSDNQTAETNSTGYVCVGTTKTDFDANGGLIVWFLVILYTFLGIAIICDEYFVTALEKLAEVMNLSDDVAGATLMAAGSSAPELATAMVSILIQPGDEGLGAIVGSAVFNIMIIIGVSAIYAGRALDINPFPFSRDCIFYFVSIVMLVLFILDGQVQWWQALILVLGYFVYIGFMVVNQRVERAVRKCCNRGGGGRTANGGAEVSAVSVSIISATGGAADSSIAGSAPPSPPPSPPEKKNSKQLADSGEVEMLSPAAAEISPALAATPGDDDDKKEDDDEEKSWAEMSVSDKLYWLFSQPYVFVFLFTVPDIRVKRWEEWYVMSFVMSVVWIGILSWIMLLASTKACCIIQIPKVLMGIVVISAGTSVPDALSSMMVAKQGQGDMAVSNVLGSNVFNIFLGLGLPWLIYTGVNKRPYTSEALQGDIVWPVSILFLYILLLLLVMIGAGWKLYPKMGWLLISLHFVFIAWTLITSPLGENPALIKLPVIDRPSLAPWNPSALT